MAVYDKHLLDGEHLGHLISKIKTLVGTKIDNPTTKSNGNFLKFNGTNWVAADVPDTGVLSVDKKTGETVVVVDNTDPANPKLGIAVTATQGNVTLTKETDGIKANVADNALTIGKTNGLQAALDAKQDELTAGSGITLNNNTIGYDEEVISSVEYVDDSINDTMNFIIQERDTEKAARQAGDGLLQDAIDAEAARAKGVEDLKANSADLGTAAEKDFESAVTEDSTNLVTSGAVFDAIKDLTGFHFEIVTTLPTVGQPNIIYLVLKSSGPEGNIYTEYAWINNKYEQLGDTQITLEYLTNAEIDTIWSAN